MVLVKIDPSLKGEVCEILESSLAECYVKEEGIIDTDEFGIGIIDSMNIKYEIVDGHKTTCEDIYKLPMTRR